MAAIQAKADISWIPRFQEKYELWFAEAKALLESHQYAPAFKTYPFPQFQQTPWAPVRVPLSSGRLGIISTAAIYRRDLDPPFADTPEGDSQIIGLPREVNRQTLDTVHAHIPQELIRADVNVALPIDHFRALVREGRIGELAVRFFSMNGYRTRADEVAIETAPQIAAALAEDGVTHALIVPV
jgi:hypothetical protein